jgi:alanyl-tRNA synthetase
MMTGSQIRRKFLDFFIGKGHREVHSSSLVPHNDPTLLFTNAGMNQFKDVFLGLEKRDYVRATSSQKCVRAGGKHNDLENVGFTNRHHTFFEMLGNFSFGDYFKKDAVAYAWELITSAEWFGIDQSKLYVTIFNGEGGVPRDAEAHDLWVAQGVAKDRIFEAGLKDNFWQMGDTGPCGPCSEIHYDMGRAASDAGHADCAFPCDCGRYVEIWNLVFMQFDRDASGKLNPLPKPSIDTGAGLERLAAVMLNLQDPTKISNYDTDLFVPLIEEAARLTGTSLAKELEKEARAKSAASLRVIADHSRAATFLISDGVLPANDGRGYVLRKIIRRAIRHGRLLGYKQAFLFMMSRKVVKVMAEAYPELMEHGERIAATISREEDRFANTIDKGMQELDDDLTVLRGKGSDLYPGEQAFTLYDTFGLPADFIQDTLRDAGLKFDQAGFDRAMTDQRTRARASWKGAAKQTANPAYQQLPKSEFEGYRQTRSEGCEVLAIIKDGQGVQGLAAGEEGEVILDHTPFYAESGGQVGDRGVFYSDELNAVVAEVRGCYSPVQGVRAHQVVVKSVPFSGAESKAPLLENREKWGTRGAQSDTSKAPPYERRVGWDTQSSIESTRVAHPTRGSLGGGFALRVGDKVDAVVDTGVREATMRNHTATHLLHAGLREILGKHVKQAGSLVAPNHLRFDFSHFTAVEDEELQDIEDLINKEVLRNVRVETIADVPIDVAVNEYHAMALFGEKYGDRVRVVKIGDFSTELCGGTHTGATGEIGLIKILKEGSVSSGVRRVEAVTGEGSLQHFRKDYELEKVVSGFVGQGASRPTLPQSTRKDGAATSEERPESKAPPYENRVGWATHGEFSPAEALKAELEKKDAEIKRLSRELDQVRMKSASSSVAAVGEKIREVRGVKVLAHRVDNLERGQMRTLVDQLRDKIGSGVVVLGSATDGNVALIVGVTKDLTSRIQAGKVIGPVAQKVGGKGGGRPDLAEAGGKDAGALDAALDGVYGVVEGLLG